jgi:hypothetical protein
MAETTDGAEPGCQYPGCGLRVVANEMEFCAQHLPEEGWESLLSSAESFNSYRGLDARGASMSKSTVERILAAARKVPTAGEHPGGDRERLLLEPIGAIILPGFVFDDATFPEDVNFGEVIFAGPVSFERVAFAAANFVRAEFRFGGSFVDATFRGPALFVASVFAPSMGALAMRGTGAVSFAGVTFQREANFSGADLGPLASFAKARFARSGVFRGAVFGPAASFEDAEIGTRSSFVAVRFGDALRFTNASLGQNVDFGRAAFGDSASFAGASFGTAASFEHCRFGVSPSFAGASFGSQTRLGPCSATDAFILDGVTLGDGSQLDVRAQTVVASGIRVAGGADLRLDCSVLLLEGAHFEAPTTLSGARVDLDLDTAADDTHYESRPAVPTFGRANVACLLLADVALSQCRFLGAHNLDRLRFGSGVEFAETPRGWQCGWTFPPVWRWSRRRIIAEEGSWRQLTAKGKSWQPAGRAAAPIESSHPAVAVQLAVQELRGLRDRIEQRTKVVIPDEVIDAAAALASHLPGENLVDDAIELLDSAVARRRHILDAPSAEEQAAAAALMKRIETARRLKEELIDSQEFERAANQRNDERILEAELATLSRSRARLPNPDMESSAAVEDVVAVAARWTGRAETLSQVAGGHLNYRQADYEPQPREIASLYRALRKGREDERDAPGAADFYYGEMEMRRNAASGMSAERIVLSAYWLVAGYGLRASRAVAGLLIAVLVATVLFHLGGLKPHANLTAAAIYAAEATVPGLSVPSHTLNNGGELLRLLLHLAGPLFIGLALLSLRGRIRR